MIVVIVLFLIMNQTEFRLVHNKKENCHYDHIPPCDFKVIRNRKTLAAVSSADSFNRAPRLNLLASIL